MADEQKLSEEEKIKLIEFFKNNEALWSSETHFRNNEEKASIKQQLVELYDGKYTENFLDTKFRALRTGFVRELKKYKEKEPKKKMEIF